MKIAVTYIFLTYLITKHLLNIYLLNMMFLIYLMTNHTINSLIIYNQINPMTLIDNIKTITFTKIRFKKD